MPARKSRPAQRLVRAEKMRGRILLVMALMALAGCKSSPAPQPPVEKQAPPPAKPVVLEEPDLGYNLAEFFIDGNAVQGGLLVVRAPSKARRVLFNGDVLKVAKDGFFLIGFDRDAPATATLTAEMRDGSRIEKTLSVAPGNWRIEKVNASLTGSAKSEEEFNAVRDGEIAQMVAARALGSNSEGWRQQFIWPVKGRISGLFGSQRIYRGTPASYHSGMDIAVPQGTIFVAPADGVVTLAAETAFTLEGHMLIVDHGMGLGSAFLHCSELLVKKGDVVKQGQPIAKVGMTGRASGPHLHWGLKWNGAKVDPKLLLPPA